MADKTKKAKKAKKPKKAKTEVKAVAKPKVEPKSEPVAEVKEEAKPEVEKPKKVKKAKKSKALVSTALELPESPAYKYKPADTGWRNYRLWTSHEVDYDEKAKYEEICDKIKTTFKKNKKALVESLTSFDAKQLLVKTDLKKDLYPYEPFIEAWIADATIEEVKDKLVVMEGIFLIDPDFIQKPIKAKIERADEADTKGSKSED